MPSNSIRARWDDWRPTKTVLFWTAAIAVIATLIIGFGPGGWVTAGTAGEMSAQAAAQARHQLATAVCLEEFMAASDAKQRLERVKKATWYERDELVSAGGWATMPDKKEPNIVVASMCASRLAEL